MKYRVIYGRTIIDLEKKVNYQMEDGWIPVGSVYYHEDRWYQPLTKVTS